MSRLDPFFPFFDPSGHGILDFFKKIGNFFKGVVGIIAAVLFVAVLWTAAVLSGGNPYLVSAAIGGTIGLVQGGVSAVINGGDIGLGMLVGAAIGAATAVAAHAVFEPLKEFAFNALVSNGISQTTANVASGFIAGIPAGAISGAGSGAVQAYGGGTGSIGDIGRSILKGAGIGAATGAAFGAFFSKYPINIANSLKQAGKWEGVLTGAQFVVEHTTLFTIGTIATATALESAGVFPGFSGSTSGKIGRVGESPTDWRDEIDKERQRRREVRFQSLNISPVTP